MMGNKSSTGSSSDNNMAEEQKLVDAVKRSAAFQMLLTGRRELVAHAFQMMPSSDGDNVANPAGLTPVHIAAIRGNIAALKILLETSACGGVDGTAGVGADEDTRRWTALTYAALAGQVKVVKLLLDRGASVDGKGGGETPLQVAAGAGHVKVAEMLIAHGASPFVTSSGEKGGGDEDNMSMCMTRVGCPAPVSVAAIHGHRRLLHVMVTQALSLSKMPPPPSSSSSSPRPPPTRDNHHGHQHHRRNKPQSPLAAHPIGKAGKEEEVLSLEEILAEGAQGNSDDDGVGSFASDPHLPFHSRESSSSTLRLASSSSSHSGNPHFSKSELRRLQESMYHASESGHLELALDLRNLGVGWTVHTWVSTLRTAHDGQAVAVINELLQDFSAEWVEQTQQGAAAQGQQAEFFCDVGLPLLFSIFQVRYS